MTKRRPSDGIKMALHRTANEITLRSLAPEYPDRLGIFSHGELIASYPGDDVQCWALRIAVVLGLANAPEVHARLALCDRNITPDMLRGAYTQPRNGHSGPDEEVSD